MAKDMPSAAAAPTSRQMVAAPMGLRSAMKRYAEGGDVPQEMTFLSPDNRRREEPRSPEIYPATQDESTMTLDDGTVIRGYQGIGTPEFFAHYANDPVIMAKLREAYGFTGDAPEYQQPQIGYNPEENVPTTPTYEPMFEPMYEPMPEPMYKPPEPMYEPMYERPEEARTDSRMEMLRKALSGQGVGSLIESQRLAELLRSMGYSK